MSDRFSPKALIDEANCVRSRFEEGKPADPTKNMSPEDAKKWIEMNQKHKDEFKKAEEQVVSRVAQRHLYGEGVGSGIKMASMWVLFIEGRKIKPFNIDTINEINALTIPVMAKNGDRVYVPLTVGKRKSSGPLTRPQELSGLRRENLVEIRFPEDARKETLKILVLLGKKHNFRVESSKANYQPVPRVV